MKRKTKREKRKKIQKNRGRGKKLFRFSNIVKDIRGPITPLGKGKVSTFFSLFYY